jgi:hypothetical protein
MSDSHEVVNRIVADAQWYSILWMRWIVVYWVLTLLAAGTAISTAIRSAYTTQHPAAKGGTPLPSSFDGWLMGLAATTVIATVLLGAMRPDQAADRYRFGDLLLQDALTDYSASQKQDPDVRALLSSWHQAQQVLEGGMGALAPSVAASAQRDTRGMR